MLTIVVIAKECVPGRVKTRLTPALTPEQAAAVAYASLSDTLDAVAATARAVPQCRRVLAFDGDPDNAPAQAEGFDIVQQTGGALDIRLGAIFDACEGPTLLVGMDTPQLTPAHLRAAVDGLVAAGSRSETHAHAWLGPADDGGFWALGMTDPDGSLIRGVEMSRDDTGQEQYDRLISGGLGVSLLPHLVDVDTFADAVAVAAIAPTGRFARAFADSVSASSSSLATTPSRTNAVAAARS